MGRCPHMHPHQRGMGTHGGSLPVTASHLFIPDCGSGRGCNTQIFPVGVISADVHITSCSGSCSESLFTGISSFTFTAFLPADTPTPSLCWGRSQGVRRLSWFSSHCQPLMEGSFGRPRHLPVLSAVLLSEKDRLIGERTAWH